MLNFSSGVIPNPLFTLISLEILSGNRPYVIGAGPIPTGSPVLESTAYSSTPNLAHSNLQSMSGLNTQVKATK
jgi:hypothetical protein